MLVRSGVDCGSLVSRAVGRVGLSSEQGSLAAALSRTRAPHWGVVERGGAGLTTPPVSVVQSDLCLNKFVNSDGQWLFSLYKILTYLLTYLFTRLIFLFKGQCAAVRYSFAGIGLRSHMNNSRQYNYNTAYICIIISYGRSL